MAGLLSETSLSHGFTLTPLVLRSQIYESNFYEGNDEIASLVTIVPKATVLSLQSPWLLHLSHEAELLDVVIDHMKDEGISRRREIVALDQQHDTRTNTTARRIVQWGEGIQGPTRKQLRLLCSLVVGVAPLRRPIFTNSIAQILDTSGASHSNDLEPLYYAIPG